ncbi:hypothetical protein [Streptomyces misionensis]|uniref:hypothetical protein n=1 Tax=Streptomyces misionensis TaxID=67331 RepID=UPI0033B127E4
MTPRERWLQRILHARGVRPVGHSDPAREDEDATAPVAPVIHVPPLPPEPSWPPAGARRISSTAPGSLPGPGRTITLDPDMDEVREPFPEAPADVENQTDEGPAEYVAEETQAGPVAKAPARARPVRDALQRWAGRTEPRRPGNNLTDDRNFRIALFNLSAAAVGYLLSLAGVVNTYLHGAEQAARGVLALVLAAGAALGAWWITRHPAVRHVLPYPFIARTLIIAGSAETARRTAPLLVAWLNENGVQWGLGPDAVSLLITSGGISFALWWFIDRRLRRFPWPVRWFFRIPLATAAVCTLRYGNPLT